MSGFWSRVKRRKLNAGEVAHILEAFLEGRGGPWDWDDFTSGKSLDDLELEAIRKRCRIANEIIAMIWIPPLRLAQGRDCRKRP